MEKALRKMSWLIGLLFFLAPLTVFAQNKVVVVPLFGDEPKPTASVPAPVPKTGQTTSQRLGDDGDLQKGVTWPVPRFTDHGNGTVTDDFTGLMWVKAPHSLTGNSEQQTWDNAIDFCNGLTHAGHSDWRLPNVRELQSLIDYGRYAPALPSGHPFTGALSSFYWSSTTPHAVNTDNAWGVFLSTGSVLSSYKTNTRYVWPVRAGE